MLKMFQREQRRPRRLLLCAFAAVLLPCNSHALQILEPPQLAGKKLACPPMSAITGHEIHEIWSTAERGAEVILLRANRMRELCAGKKLDDIENKVVLIEDFIFCQFKGIEDWYQMFHESGPAAVVSMSVVNKKGGYTINLWETTSSRKRRSMMKAETYFLSCGTDYADVWEDLINAAREAEADRGSKVSLLMTTDPNRYKAHWQGPWYWFAARTLLPSWGFLTVLYAVNILRAELGDSQKMKLHHYALINESVAVGCFSFLMLLGGQLADDIMPWGLHTITFTAFTGMGFATTAINCAVFNAASGQLRDLQSRNPLRTVNELETGTAQRWCCGILIDRFADWWGTAIPLSNGAIAGCVLCGMVMDLAYSIMIGNDIIPDSDIYVYWQSMYCLGQWCMSVYLFSTFYTLFARLRAFEGQPKFAVAFRHLGQWMILLGFSEFFLPTLGGVIIFTGSHLDPVGCTTWFPVLCLLRMLQGWAQVCPYITSRSRAFLVDWEFTRFSRNLLNWSGIKIFSVESRDDDDDIVSGEEEEAESLSSIGETLGWSTGSETPGEETPDAPPPASDHKRRTNKAKENSTSVSTLKHAALDLVLLIVTDGYIFAIVWFMTHTVV